tara:strand:+ start:378 stop:695 length:318 start_codon:yes stop_codon:yes gene_type:complete
MRKIDDNELFWLMRIIPLTFLSYFQFLSWEKGDWWSVFQWSAIIASSIALGIFIMHMMEFIELNKEQGDNSSKVALWIHWCMVWAFAFHIFRFIREAIDLIMDIS